MKKGIILFISWLTIVMVSCKKHVIEEYSSPHYIQFVKPVTDTLDMSFFFYPGKSEVVLSLPVMLTGFMPEEDLKYSITLDSKASTAWPAHYAAFNEFVYGKNKVKDSVKITIKYTPDMDAKQFLLVLDIAGGNNIFPGETNYSRSVLRVSNLVVKPVWWNANMDRLYLGQYSEKKFRLFMQVTGVGDLSVYSVSQQRALMIMFKNYLLKMIDEGTPVMDENGMSMLSTVPLIG